MDLDLGLLCAHPLCSSSLIPPKAFFAVFSGAEIPAHGSSGPSTGISGPIFSIRGFWLILFRVSLWRGSGNLPRKFPRKFPGVRNFRPRKYLAKSFSRFLSGGGLDFRTGGFAPEISGPPDIPGYAPEVPAPGREFRYLTPEFPASRFSNG